LELSLLKRTHPDFEDHTSATGFIFSASGIAEQFATAAATGGEEGEKTHAQGRFRAQHC
jgi:hypothetical protein